MNDAVLNAMGERDLSEEALAKKAGVSRSTVMKAKHGGALRDGKARRIERVLSLAFGAIPRAGVHAIASE